jgi:VWFA-related protein
VVRDNIGSVSGLTQNDFKLFDQGKQQRIAAFSVKSREPEVRAVNELQAEATNRAAGTGTTVILFDMLNTADQEAGKPSAPQAYARVQLVKYLRSITPAQTESYALFTLLKGLQVVQDFTTDPELILRAGKKLSPEHSADQGAEDLGVELLAAAPDLHDAIANEMYRNSVKEMQDFAQKNRALITAEALETIAKHLQGTPGRKKLIWLSASFPASKTGLRSHNGQQTIESQEFGREIERAVQVLNDANIAVYPIDPRDPYNAGLAADGLDAMNLFANGTGGKAFYARTDLADAIRQSVSDTQITYTLGFYPSDLKADGTFHSLSVSLARSGVEVRARKGYFAPDARPVTEKEIRKSMEQALNGPVNATGLGFSARLNADKSKPGLY